MAKQAIKVGNQHVRLSNSKLNAQPHTWLRFGALICVRHSHLKLRRQLLRLLFWLISRLRSMNTSSRLVTVSQCRQRVWFTSRPWKMSCTHVLGCCTGVEDEAEPGKPVEGAAPEAVAAACACFFASASSTSHAWFSK